MKTGQGLSSSAQDYLKVIWSAGEWSDEPVTSKAVADRLGVSPSTVSEALRRLADQGFVEHAPYGAITLTEQGAVEAKQVVRRHRLLETFLHQILGYSWDEVHAEAELLEHAVSDTFVDRLDQLLGRPARDPHGDPIPDGDGQLPDLPAIRLAEGSPGEQYSVARVSDRDTRVLQYLSEVGIGLDTPVEVVHLNEPAGIVTVTSDGRRLDLGLAAAQAVWVVPLSSR